MTEKRPANAFAGSWRTWLWEIPDRRIVMLLSLLATILFVLAIWLLTVHPLPADVSGVLSDADRSRKRMAEILLDWWSHYFHAPFTIQTFEHFFFFIGLGELYVRWRVGARELGFLEQGFLPEDDQTILQASDLGSIRRKVHREFDREHGFLPALIDVTILQFQSGRSIDQAVSVMTSSLELIEHRVDLRYGIVRYIAWLIPTLGFIGTVIGLGGALAQAGIAGQEVDIHQVAQHLSVGFDCTMVALVQSAILVFILQIVQEKEEMAVNLSGSYTLRNLVNRLYEGGK
ncbi:MAG: MotA/TolQ/ExbB proton channel family protein [Gammaproteobacteria bacterium]